MTLAKFVKTMTSMHSESSLVRKLSTRPRDCTTPYRSITDAYWCQKTGTLAQKELDLISCHSPHQMPQAPIYHWLARPSVSFQQ